MELESDTTLERQLDIVAICARKVGLPPPAEVVDRYLGRNTVLVLANGSFFYVAKIYEHGESRIGPVYRLQPEFPIPSCLDPNTSPSSTRAMVVSLTNAVNHPIKLTKPSVVVVNWRSMGSGGGFHYVCTPFELLQARTSPLVTSLHL